jgi:hypothetical protein
VRWELLSNIWYRFLEWCSFTHLKEIYAFIQVIFCRLRSNNMADMWTFSLSFETTVNLWTCEIFYGVRSQICQNIMHEMLSTLFSNMLTFRNCEDISYKICIYYMHMHILHTLLTLILLPSGLWYLVIWYVNTNDLQEYPAPVLHTENGGSIFLRNTKTHSVNTQQ